MTTQINNQSPSQEMTPEIKNSIPQDGPTVLENGRVVDASFSAVGEVHWYRFTYPNSPVTIELTGPVDEYSVQFFYENLDKGGGADMHSLIPEFGQEDTTIIYQFDFAGIYNVYISITGSDAQSVPDGEYTISMALNA